MTSMQTGFGARTIIIFTLGIYAIVQSQDAEFRFVSEPSSAVASLGDRVVLNCDTNVPATSVEWYFDGASLSPEPAGEINSNHQRRKRYKDDRSRPRAVNSREQARRGSARKKVRRRKGGWGKKKKSESREGHRYVRSVDTETYIDAQSLGVRMVEDRLEIDRLAPKNAGTYRCAVSIPKGSIRSSNALVQIAHLSNFSSGKPEIIKVGPGAAVLPCRIQRGSVPSPIIKWEIDGHLLKSGKNGQYAILPSGSLLVKNATASATSTFRCLAQNRITSQTIPAPHPSSLQVEDRLEKARIIYPHSNETINVTARAGERLLMACISDDLSKTVWTRDNGDIPFSAAITEAGLSLNTTEEDSGVYKCQTHENSARVQYNLTISGPAQCQPTTETFFNLNAINGNSIAMGCSSKQAGSAWQWYHNGVRISDGGGSTLQISSPKLGFYQCFSISDSEECSVVFTVDNRADDTTGIILDQSEDYFALKMDADSVPPPAIERTGVPSSSTSHTIKWTVPVSGVKLISIKYYKEPYVSAEGKVFRYPDNVVNVVPVLKKLAIKGLEPSSRYSVEMVAVSERKTRSEMIISSFRTGDIEATHPTVTEITPQIPVERIRVPRPPSKLRVNKISARQVSLMWSTRGNGGSPIMGYKVQVKVDKGEWKTHGETKSYPYEIVGLKRGKFYRFRIIAFNIKGDSKPSHSSKSFPRRQKSLSHRPTILAVTAGQWDTIRVEWEYDVAAAQISGYYIYFRPTDSDDEADYVKKIYDSVPSSVYKIKNLQPGTQYDVKMQAYNRLGPSPFSNVIITEIPKGPSRSDEEDEQVGYRSDVNDPTRAQSHRRSMIYLISGIIVAAILVVLLFTVFCYWKKRAAKQRESAPPSKANHGNSAGYSAGKQRDHIGMSKLNPTGHTPPRKACSANHSPADTKCHCSRHHSNHSSLGRDATSYHSYPVSPVGFEYVSPNGAYPGINGAPMHVIMDPRHYGIGRWVRGGEFCHIIPVDARKMSADAGQREVTRVNASGQMVTRAFDGNVTTDAVRHDHGYHSNDGSDSQLEKSEDVSNQSDTDAGMAGAAAAGVVTLAEAHTDSRSPTPAEELIENTASKTEVSSNCEGDVEIESTPFLISDDKS